MIFADKIIRLRKKNGWSQEELAEKMNVSRQAVSKWEGAQTIPDIGKMLRLSELFSVTTDYLLKDEIEDEEYTRDEWDSGSTRKISLDLANRYLNWRRRASIKMAFAIFLTILSPITLIILGAVSEDASFGLSESMAGFWGLSVMFILIAISAVIFLLCRFKNSEYEFLDKEPFECEYGVKGMVRERQNQYRPEYIRNNIIGICICILSPISLFLGMFTDKEMLAVIGLTVTFLLAGIGTMFIVRTGIIMASYQRLLGEYDFS